MIAMSNLGLSVPEANDPVDIWDISSVFAAINAAFGRPVFELNTQLKMIIPAINELVDRINAADYNHTQLYNVTNIRTTVFNIADEVTEVAPGVNGLNAWQIGKLVHITFAYKPTATGFSGTILQMPASTRPPTHTAFSVATQQSTLDAAKAVRAHISPGGAVTVVATGDLPTYEMIFSVTYIAG